MVAPVWMSGSPHPIGFVANRAHHADVGGAAPGSMPLATDIFQEGVRIPPVPLVRGGRLDTALLRVLLANMRAAGERRGDLSAQLAALRLGARRLQELAREIGTARTQRLMKELQDYSERLTRSVLRKIPAGRYTASDFLDDDGCGTRNIEIRVAITVRGGNIAIDFTGSSRQVRGGLNANAAVTFAAVFYVIRCLADTPIPPTAGLLRPVCVFAPAGSVVNARFPAAVAGGNVETSQRIVDVLLRALAPALPHRIPAASSGSMNNVAVGGVDPRSGREFAYYETIAGGSGGGPNRPGVSGVHTHMTNTRNTPIEALEAYYPLRVRQYRIRRGSGGAGRHPGGDGLIRELEFLTDAQVSLLTERRRVRPYGLQGGAPGLPGQNFLRASGSARVLPAKGCFSVRAGDRLQISTPGGAGWGRPHVRRPTRA